MIPRQLTLKNFLSYQEATIDFQGLHVACICGPNGAGKSSLLEAITWALWGNSRVAIEDDIIHLGADEAQVDFMFEHQQQIYRVLRSRRRRQSSTLEFQVQTPVGFRSLTERGLRATQQLILQHLRLDYDTFINSAYLRQGRADEFMLKRPSERKQILADLLKLDQYDGLSEQAKEQTRQYKAQIALLEQTLARSQQQLQGETAIQQEQANLEAAIAQTDQAQAADQTELQQLRHQRQQRQTWQQQLTFHQQQQQRLAQDVQRLSQDLTALQQQQQQLAAVLTEEAAILQGHATLQRLQAEAEQQAEKFQAYQQAQELRSQLQQQLSQQLNQLQQRRQQAEANLQALQDQEADIQNTLQKAADVEAAVAQLQQARQRLSHLDQLQAQASPLMQRRQQLQSELDRAQARITARIEELQTTENQLQQQQQRRPQLAQAVLSVADQIEYLEKRQVYLERVREKGLERRRFMERLQAHQRDYEVQIAQLDQKMQLLSQPDAACPLCDRALDADHWQVVLERHQQEQQELQNQIWVIREQLAVSEREIQVLRREYREIEQELNKYGSILERRGQLQEQLNVTDDVQTQLQRLLQEQAELTRSLQTCTYATDVHAELSQLDASLAQLNYDDRDHALARGQVERLRWAEIKQAEIKQAQRRQAQVALRRPELAAEIADLDAQLTTLQSSPLQQQVNQVEQQLADLNYSLEQHNRLRQALRQATSWQERYQQLRQAQQQLPQVQQRLQDVQTRWQARSHEQTALQAQIQQFSHQLEHTPDPIHAIHKLEAQIQQRRLHRDQQLARLGQLQQQQRQLEGLRQQVEAQRQELAQARQQFRVYQELTHAFGRNGIQALMIENVLPQLESETNRLLSRLSTNQLHVQFVTQKAGRRSSKLIDTLEILIADAQGTRPYETYSGGEAFRVNFAIRLALARLLAQRSGTALQMLIVDEGFGTQDAAGCERLIAAVNAIAPDFACILMVTHVPHLREAFQTRIDVSKTNVGSQLEISM
jgi:exonuclease SbcC